MNRRQFTVAGVAALMGGRASWALPAPVAALQALRVDFHPAPRDMPVGFFQAGLEDRLDDLRKDGLSFHEIRLPPLRTQREGSVTGICLAPMSTFPRMLVVVIAVFLSSFYPERRVCVALGAKTVTLSRPEDVLLLPTQFPELTHEF